jgi:hypothetical protein
MTATRGKFNEADDTDTAGNRPMQSDRGCEMPQGAKVEHPRPLDKGDVDLTVLVDAPLT